MPIEVKNILAIAYLKELLGRELEMKDQCVARKICRMEIHKDQEKGHLRLNQRRYLEKSMSNAKVLSNLLSNCFILSTT